MPRRPARHGGSPGEELPETAASDDDCGVGDAGLCGGTEALFQDEGVALDDLGAEAVPLGRLGQVLGEQAAPLDEHEGDGRGDAELLALLG